MVRAFGNITDSNLNVDLAYKSAAVLLCVCCPGGLLSPGIGFLNVVVSFTPYKLMLMP